MPEFIPKTYKSEPVTIRLTYDKLERVDSLANDFNMSRSEFINQCIDFALKHMKKKDTK